MSSRIAHSFLKFSRFLRNQNVEDMYKAGKIVSGAGGLYPNDECGLMAL